MEKGGAGLQYVTCVICYAMLEMRNGREWCVQTCRPSEDDLKTYQEQGTAALSAITKAILHIDNKTSRCINPWEYDGEKCKYLLDTQDDWF